jgi:hypothetical protein
MGPMGEQSKGTGKMESMRLVIIAHKQSMAEFCREAIAREIARRLESRKSKS